MCSCVSVRVRAVWFRVWSVRHSLYMYTCIETRTACVVSLHDCIGPIPGRCNVCVEVYTKLVTEDSP